MNNASRIWLFSFHFDAVEVTRKAQERKQKSDNDQSATDRNAASRKINDVRWRLIIGCYRALPLPRRDALRTVLELDLCHCIINHLIRQHYGSQLRSQQPSQLGDDEMKIEVLLLNCLGQLQTFVITNSSFRSSISLTSR